MIFSLHKTKKHKRNASILRGLGSALVAVVIAVNVFGAFAQIVTAQTLVATPRTPQDYVTNARVYAQQAISLAQQSSGVAQTDQATFTQAANLAAQSRAASTNAENSMRQASTLAGGAAAVSEIDARIRGPEGAPVLTLVNQAREASIRSNTVLPSRTDRGSATSPTSQRATNQAQNAVPSTGRTGGDTGKTASHPVDICFSRNTSASICIASIFYVFFVDLTSPIAYLSGAVFDAFASISLESGTYASAVIAKGWVIARDIANMAFVFILIYIAFMLILNLEGVGIARQIAGVIAVALLINFSFFFTRVVIDMSNILAHEFYDQINGASSLANPSILVAGAQAIAPTSISEKVMAGVNPQTLLSEGSFTKFLSGGSFVGNLAILVTLFLIFGIINVILAAVFLTAAFQFLARIVALWFAIILSPIAFISFITPKMNGIWTRWLKLLLNNAFYAPAFLFVIYIAVKMLDGGLMSANIASFLGGSATNASGADPMRVFLNSIVGVVLRLSIIVGLFIAALKVGSWVGAEGADRAEKWGKSISARGNGAIVGGLVGGVGRRTLGFAGNVVARNETIRNLATGNREAKGVTGFVTRTIGLRTAGKIVGKTFESGGIKAATSSFDARASKTLTGALSAVPEGAAALSGTAQKGGYRQIVKDKVEKLKHEEHERHDTIEEKTTKEKVVKEEINYDSKKTTIETEHKSTEDGLKQAISEAKDAQVSSQAELTQAIQNLAQARQSGNQQQIQSAEVRVQTARGQVDAARQSETTANSAIVATKKNKDSRIKALDDQVAAEVGKADKERKESFVSDLETRRAGNFWMPSRGALRAAAEIKKGKSKDAQLAEAVKKFVGDEAPKEEKHDEAPRATTPAQPAAAAHPPAGGGGGHH